MRALPALAVTTVLLGAGIVVPTGAATAREGEPSTCESIESDSTGVVPDDSDSVPLSMLDVDRVQAYLTSLGERPGAGVGVAVLDSGISTKSSLLTVKGAVSMTDRPADAVPVDPHGTSVAGLIAAADRPGDRSTGIAPGADLYDVRVFDRDPPGEGVQDDGIKEQGVSTDGLIAGLTWVANNARRLGIKIANISLAVTPDPQGQLERVVRRVSRANVVIVASSGNRPTDEADKLYEAFAADTGTDVGPGEDAADAVWPAGYDEVVAVSTTAGGMPADTDPKSIVLANSQIDVAAPSANGVSIALNGSTCRIQLPATSFAAAEVSGVLALLRGHFPKDTAAQSVARLERTADGTFAEPTDLQGKGIVQPFEALTRPLHPAKNGSIVTAVQQDDRTRATAPAAQPDVLDRTRHDAVWWGLIGGGVLLMALLLRPVLARRRD